MKKDIDNLKASFQVSYSSFEESRAKAQIVKDLYHNRQYTQSQLETLRKRGAPAETFNIVKLFSRVMIGYYSTVVNTVKATPTHPRDAVTATIANDIAAHTFRVSQFETEGDNFKLDLLLTGLGCARVHVEPTGDEDEFGRPVNQVKLSYVPSHQILLDPASTKADYSDARFLHRYKWITREDLEALIKGTTYTIDSFDNERNHLGIPEADYPVNSSTNGFNGHFQEFNNYLLVVSIVVDDEGKRWELLWIDDIIISEKEVTYKEVRFPYRIQKLYEAEDASYYGIFEEVIESQHAINQALVKLQQAVNTQKIFVEDGAVEDIEKFKNQVNRINAIIEVESLSGIKVENLSAEAREQYEVIDRSLARVKMVLGITDSFLGMAFASDSGRKVKLQQNATAMAMRHLTVRIEQFYRLLGWDVILLAKQYYYANQLLLITDNMTGDRWVEINKPLKVVQSIDETTGEPIEDFVYEEVLDPETSEPMVVDGNLLLAPVATAESALDFSTMDIALDSVSYNDEDEKAQLLVEQILSGVMGQSLKEIDPASYMQAVALGVKMTKTRHSPQMADIFNAVADKLNQGQLQQPEQQGMQVQQSKKSQALKLPQNTNEGVG